MDEEFYCSCEYPGCVCAEIVGRDGRVCESCRDGEHNVYAGPT